jgi:uncharacterized oligopeptide transporter (OPT) family protein
VLFPQFAEKGNRFHRRRRENSPVDLARLAWLTVVMACLIAVLVLALQSYYGYAGVTLAVAISAAINLR